MGPRAFSSVLFLQKLIRCQGQRYFSSPPKSILKLSERGMYNDMFPANSANAIDDLLKSSSQCVYAGFDPTADSLHVGSLLVLINLLHWQKAGHQVIALIGDATGHIGDPSERSTERPYLESKVVFNNAEKIKKNIETIFNNYSKYYSKEDKLLPIKIVNNYEWYHKMNAVEFVGYVGRHFRMGTMLGRESVSQRLNSVQGMSFTEFSYQIFQSFDWLHLLREHNCRFQIGGSDQMGNIVSGHDLISRTEKQSVYGITLPLIKSTTGDKFGKSAGNAVWLSAEKTSPFDLYQYFVRTPDSDIANYLQLFTFDTLNFIKELMNQHQHDGSKRRAQTHLAEFITRLVHGEEGLKAAKVTTSVLYESNLRVLSELSTGEATKVFHGAPCVKLKLKNGMTCLSASLEAGCFPTERDAKRIFEAGGFYINYEKIKNPQEIISTSAHILPNNISLFRVGKKNFYVIDWEI